MPENCIPRCSIGNLHKLQVFYKLNTLTARYVRAQRFKSLIHDVFHSRISTNCFLSSATTWDRSFAIKTQVHVVPEHARKLLGMIAFLNHQQTWLSGGGTAQVAAADLITIISEYRDRYQVHLLCKFGVAYVEHTKLVIITWYYI